MQHLGVGGIEEREVRGAARFPRGSALSLTREPNVTVNVVVRKRFRRSVQRRGTSKYGHATLCVLTCN